MLEVHSVFEDDPDLRAQVTAEPWPRVGQSFMGFELVESLGAEPALKSYHLLPSVKGDLLLKLGRRSEARAEFERAASLTRNERERGFLLKRAKECTVEH